MEKEKTSCEMQDADKQCSGTFSKEYENEHIALRLDIRIKGTQMLNKVLCSIAVFSRKFYLECASHVCSK